MALRELKPGEIWAVEEPAQKAGFQFGARMTIVRLPDGALWIHSPLEPTEEVRRGLHALGPVRHIVAPARFHYLHAAAFALAYPDTLLYGVRSTLSRFPAARAPRLLTQVAPEEWGGVLQTAVFQGSRLYDEADFLHRPSRTLIVTDLLFNLPAEVNAITRIVGRLLGIGSGPAAARSFGLTIRDRAAVRESLHTLLRWDFDGVVLCHGDCLPSGGREVFRTAFRAHLAGERD